MIQENPHCQYFLGMSEFTDQTPFDASKLVAFRKRFTPEAMAEINEAIIAAERENLPLRINRGHHSDGSGCAAAWSSGSAPANVRDPTTG
jgi:hypothetical protein